MWQEPKAFTVADEPVQTLITEGTRLGASHATLMTILREAPELREGPELGRILELLRQRRAMDLSDLPPAEQAALISARSQDLLPSAADLASRLAAAGREGRRLVVKYRHRPDRRPQAAISCLPGPG